MAQNVTYADLISSHPSFYLEGKGKIKAEYQQVNIRRNVLYDLLEKSYHSVKVEQRPSHFCGDQKEVTLVYFHHDDLVDILTSSNCRLKKRGNDRLEGYTRQDKVNREMFAIELERTNELEQVIEYLQSKQTV